MKKELLVTAAGREATITIDRASDGRWEIEVDGVRRDVEAHQVRPGTWSLVIDGHTHLVDLEPRARGLALSTGLAEALVTVEDAQTRRLRQSLTGGAPVRGEEVRAPIAGKVVKILAAAGDEIAAGQPVAVLEAMKMENEIVAERGGKVSEIKKDAGQSVETGELLMILV
jgi:acetyl-CoA/propionyl-CoA carboxylase biotin carboxyl carrier protein